MMTIQTQNLPRNPIATLLNRLPGRIAWRPLLIKAILAVAVLALLWAARRPLADLVRLLSDRETVQQAVLSYGIMGPIVLALVQFLQVIIAFIPGDLLLAAGGYIYGFPLGFALNLVTAVAASQLAFLLMRRAGRPLAERLVSPEVLDRFDGLVERHGVFFLTFSFMVPFMPGDMLNLAAGVSMIPSRRFLVINAVGRLPGVAFSTLVGAYGLQLGPEAWLAILAGVIMILALWLWRGGWQQLAELRGCPPAMAR